MKFTLNRRPAGRPMSRSGLILFFSVFLVAGLAATWFLLLRPMARVHEARQWPATPCTIVSSQVRAHRGSKDTTYSVHIVYRYTVNRREYQSDRYDFMGGSSSGRKGKQAIVRRYPPGREAVCYVNPRDPSDAVLEPRFTPMMLVGLFPLLFVGVGVGGLLWVLANKSLRKPIEGASPWQSRADWAEGRIVSSSKPLMFVAWVAAIIGNIAAWTVALILMDRFPWVVLFPFIGVWLLYAAFRQTRRWQQFGETVFEMATRPGAVGGALAGTLRLREFVRFDGGLKLSLRCIRVESRGKSTTEHILWTDEQTVAADGTDAVPVNFYIPPDCAETDAANHVLWRLEAKAPGYAAQFEVPVFKVAQDPAVAGKAFAAKQAAIAGFQRPVDSRIRVEPSWRGGTEFSFPPLRNAGAAVGMAVFIAAGAGAVTAMIVFKAPVILIVVFSLVELMVLGVLFSLWFASMTVTVNKESVSIVRAALGWRRERAVPIADITGFRLDVGMTASTPAGTTTYHNIKLVLRNGKTHTVGGWIENRMEAEWLAAEMSRCAGIGTALEIR